MSGPAEGGDPNAARVRRFAEPPTRSAEQMLRYVIVGGCGYVVAMALYAGQLAAGVAPYAAVLLSFAANGLFNFFANRAWSFPASGRPLHRELGAFGVVALASLVANYGAFYLLYGRAGIAALPAQALAIVIATPVGFLGNKLWSFRAA